MRTFLNISLFDINRTYQMFAHRSCVIPFTKITMFPYQFRTVNTTMQVLEMIWMLNVVIQANQMVFMKSLTIEQYGAGIGDYFDVRMN